MLLCLLSQGARLLHGLSYAVVQAAMAQAHLPLGALDVIQGSLDEGAYLHSVPSIWAAIQLHGTASPPRRDGTQVSLPPEIVAKAVPRNAVS